MNPKDPKDQRRLRRAVEYSRRKLRPFREKRLEMIRQYVGANYSDDGAEKAVPVNLIELMVTIYLSQLSGRAPAALVTTPHRQLRRSAMKLEMALQHLIREIRLRDTLQECAVEAIFCMGIGKVGLNIRGEVEVDGFLHDVGQPYADSVELDDWVHDISARRYEQVDFCGNRYRLPYEWVKESKMYRSGPRGKLKPTSKVTTYETDQERASDMTQGRDVQPDEYQDHVELLDLWLPKENLFITIPWHGDDEPLRIAEWDGPELGPYRILMFNRVPGNIMPLSPVSLGLDIHEMTNQLMRKMKEQAINQKTVLAYAGGAAEDAERIVSANDCEAVKVDRPDGLNEIRFNGIDQPTLAFTIMLKDLYAYMGGNLDALGGLSAQSETLGQDQLLTANASKRMAEMQSKMVAFDRDVIESLAWYLWTDPLIDLPMTYQVPNTDIKITSRFTPEDREGDFLDYNFQIDPYSIVEQTPMQRLNTLSQTFAQFIGPFAPIMQQQGMTIDFDALLQLVARYANLPELLDVMKLNPNAQAQQEGPVEGGPKQSPVTQRTYTRVNRPGGTRHGRDAVMMNVLSGAGVQPDALAAAANMRGNE